MRRIYQSLLDLIVVRNPLGVSEGRGRRQEGEFARPEIKLLPRHVETKLLLGTPTIVKNRRSETQDRTHPEFPQDSRVNLQQLSKTQ